MWINKILKHSFMQVTLSFVLLNLAPHFYFSTSNQSFISKQKQEEQEMDFNFISKG